MPIKGFPAIKNSTATVRDIHDYTIINARHAITLPSPETVWKSGCPRSYSLFHSLVFEMYRLNTQTNSGLFHRYVHRLSLRPHPRVVHVHPHRPLPEIQPRSR